MRVASVYPMFRIINQELATIDLSFRNIAKQAILRDMYIRLRDSLVVKTPYPRNARAVTPDPSAIFP